MKRNTGPSNSPLLGHWWHHCSPSLRRCLQRRNRRSVWAPEANHKQLRVAWPRPSTQAFSRGGQGRIRAGRGRWPLALWLLRTYSIHNTVPAYLPGLGDAAEVHISSMEAAAIAETPLTRLQQVPAIFFYFFLLNMMSKNITWGFEIEIYVNDVYVELALLNMYSRKMLSLL